MLEFFESYRSIDIPEKLRNDLLDSNDAILQKIESLNKINIFIGPNNSGKSLLIREILKSNSKKYIGENIWAQIQQQVSFYDKIINDLQNAFPANNISIFRSTQYGVIFSFDDLISMRGQFKQYRNEYDINSMIQHLNSFFNRDFIIDENLSYQFVDRTSQVPSNINNYSNRNILESVFKALNNLKEESVEVIKKLTALLPNSSEFEKIKIYVPAVRTLRSFADRWKLDEEIKAEYKFDKAISLISGQNFSSEFSKNRAYEKKKPIISFEKFLSEEFFESQNVDITYDEDSKTILIKIGDEKERPIYDLGDGLQMIIILMYPFFFNKGGIVAIEEPELYVHPGLQKAFIKFLTTNPKTKDFQIFIASHSNHIIDSINFSSDISIFSIHKKLTGEKGDDEINAKFIIENVAFGYSNLLNLLGITSTSVYLANCTIWVEGITDKIYLQKFIEEYLKQVIISDKFKQCIEYKEGIHYSFAFTAGDSIVHWDFADDSEYEQILDKVIVKKFCAKSMLIVDEDFGKNLERKKRLTELLKERFIVLELPEIENYLPLSALKNTALMYSSIEKVIEDVSQINITDEDICENRIGKLLDREIHSKYASAKSFSTSERNGSLKPTDKVDFCKKSLAFITQQNLTEQAKKIVENILNFIVERNK